MLRPVLLAMILAAITACEVNAEALKVYGSDAALPAMKEAAEAFGKSHGPIDVTGGPMSKWIDQVKVDSDMVFSGSEAVMAAFVKASDGRIQSAQVFPLYLRPSVILVRPGNPKAIKGLKDLFKPDLHVLVVNGSDLGSLWEDMAGRLGNIRSVRAFRANIVDAASSSSEAAKTWADDPSLDAWITWNTGQVSSSKVAEMIAVEPEYRIYRDIAIALTKEGKSKPEAGEFVKFLASPEGEAIFKKWGWVAKEE
jgi:accessory colonization factor AcfC